MPYSYKLNVFLTQTGVVSFLKVAHPPPEMAKFPPSGEFPQVGDHLDRQDCSNESSGTHIYIYIYLLVLFFLDDFNNRMLSTMM